MNAWFLEGGISSSDCVAAWQPLGAASYAASLVNLNTPGTHDAHEGMAPTWNAGTGWTFDGVSQYLDSTVIPTAGMTVIARFEYLGSIDSESCIIGHFASSGTRLQIGIADNGAGVSSCLYSNAGFLFGARPIKTGTLAVAASNAYRNGVTDGTTSAPFAGTATTALTMGARRREDTSTIDTFANVCVQAVAIYSRALTANEIATIHLAMVQIDACAEALQWSHQTATPILSPSASWEATAIQEPRPVYLGAGNWVMSYTGGFSPEAIGWATSTDGVVWTKLPHPIIGQGYGGESGTTRGSCLLQVSSTLELYYGTDFQSQYYRQVSTDGGATWGGKTTVISFAQMPSGCDGYGNSYIAYDADASLWRLLIELHQSSGTVPWRLYSATSTDRTVWTTGTLITGIAPTQSSTSSGWWAKQDGLYHLFFHRTPAADPGTGIPTDIWHATSPDFSAWTLLPGPVLPRTLEINHAPIDAIDQSADVRLVQTSTGWNAYYARANNTANNPGGNIALAQYPVNALFGGLAPVITSATTATGTVGTAFTYQITASNSPTSFGATGLPTGASVNTSTGLISFPGTLTAGTDALTISATNAGGTGEATLTITISAPATSAVYPATNTVLAGTHYGPTGAEYTGSYTPPTVPVAADVRFGVGNGTLRVPTAGQVLVGIPVDATTGNVILPAVSDVRDGVAFGSSGAISGTLDTGTPPFSLTTNEGAISGYFTNADGSPAFGLAITVLLNATAQSKCGDALLAKRLISKVTDQNGYFSAVVVGNDKITPAGSDYSITCQSPRFSLLRRAVVAGQTLDISTIT